MIDNIFSFLDSIDTLVGIISLVFSFFTFLVSLRINKRVADKVDRVELRENIDIYIGSLLTFIDILKLDSYPNDLPTEIPFFVSQFSSKHSTLPFKIKRLLKKINKVDYSRATGPNKDENYYKKVVDNFFTLKNLFEKEKRK